VSLAVRFEVARWNTVRRPEGCSARGRAATVRDTVLLVNGDRFRRLGRVEACVEEDERWL